MTFQTYKSKIRLFLYFSQLNQSYIHKIQLPKSLMNANFSTNLVNSTVDIILEKGAAELYNHYLKKKLPAQTSNDINSYMTNNQNIFFASSPKQNRMQICNNHKIVSPKIDSFSSKRIKIYKNVTTHSTLSPTNSQKYQQSTKFQTLNNTLHSTGFKMSEVKDKNEFLTQQQNLKQFFTERNRVGNKRPLTMQLGRNKLNKNQQNEEYIHLQLVEQKRAATSENKRRVCGKDIILNKKSNVIKLKSAIDSDFKQEVQMINSARMQKKEKTLAQRQTQKILNQQSLKVKNYQSKIENQFKQMKQEIEEQNQAPLQITNFEVNEGKVLINGNKTNQRNAHIIQLKFNPQQCQVVNQKQPRTQNVIGKKRNSFSTRIKRKIQISQDEFSNKGDRQLSSIPFVTLNYGIVYCQNNLQATASRKRPSNELCRGQFTTQNITKRFKSHIPSVNEARINLYSTIDVANLRNDHNNVSKFDVTTNQNEKNKFNTTFQTVEQTQRSILWRTRQPKQKNINIKNPQIFSMEILEQKLSLI